MSNFTNFIFASISSLLSIWGFYFLIKKWPKFHITIFGKILKVVYAFMLLLAIIISLVVAYERFESYWEDDRVRVITEFQGVKLGWSKDEVLFRKGEPASVDVKNDKETYLDYGAIGIMLEKGIVVKILYVCQDVSYSYEKIGGISCDSDISRIIKQYGDSKKLATSEDKLSRIYNYPNYNLAFMLSKAKVEMLAVFDSTKVPNGFSFRTPNYFDKFDPIVPESQGEWKLVKPANKNIDYDKLAAENGSINSEFDHCAPNLTKSERLRRLALRGTVRETRETGYQTYTVGNYEITFSANDVIICKNSYKN